MAIKGEARRHLKATRETYQSSDRTRTGAVIYLQTEDGGDSVTRLETRMCGGLVGESNDG